MREPMATAEAARTRPQAARTRHGWWAEVRASDWVNGVARAGGSLACWCLVLGHDVPLGLESVAIKGKRRNPGDEVRADRTLAPPRLHRDNQPKGTGSAPRPPRSAGLDQAGPVRGSPDLLGPWRRYIGGLRCQDRSRQWAWRRSSWVDHGSSSSVVSLAAAGLAGAGARRPPTGAAAKPEPPTKPDKVVIIVVDALSKEIVEKYDMDNVKALMGDGVDTPRGYLGHTGSVTVVTHNVITSGMLPKHMGWTNEGYRDVDGVLGAAGAASTSPATSATTRCRAAEARRLPASSRTTSTTPARSSRQPEGVRRLRPQRARVGQHLGRHLRQRPDLRRRAHRQPSRRRLNAAGVLLGRLRLTLAACPARHGSTTPASSRPSSTPRRTTATSSVTTRRNRAVTSGRRTQRWRSWSKENAWSGIFVSLPGVDKAAHMWGGVNDPEAATPGYDPMTHMEYATATADAQVGRIMDALEESGELDSTLVVLTADHGSVAAAEGHWHGDYRAGERLRLLQLVLRRPRERHLLQPAAGGPPAADRHRQRRALLQRLLAQRLAEEPVAGRGQRGRRDHGGPSRRHGRVATQRRPLRPGFTDPPGPDAAGAEKSWFARKAQELVDTQAADYGPDLVATLPDDTTYSVARRPRGHPAGLAADPDRLRRRRPVQQGPAGRGEIGRHHADDPRRWASRRRSTWTARPTSCRGPGADTLGVHGRWARTLRPTATAAGLSVAVVAHPTRKPVQTDDISDPMMALVSALLADGNGTTLARTLGRTSIHGSTRPAVHQRLGEVHTSRHRDTNTSLRKHRAVP